MDRDSWAQLSRLLDDALDLSPDARTRWLDSLGPEYEGLKPRLRALLAHAPAAQSPGFLGTIPKVDLAPPGPAREPDDETGAVVGPYRVLRKLGEGGMGTVWLAERTDGLIRRPVALKLPRAAWHGRALAERVARERNILAGLTHPHIARLYDAGVTPEGRSYLALEYVEGLPIEEYCARNGLGVRSRLRVFLQVVDAVAYAHAKLVVHRDLKPSNILVTADGEVRLLDFGIAKLIDEGQTGRTELTEMSGRPFTPAYASPEQVTGEPLSIASDVYSLGVVLYELLTGTRPYGIAPDSRRALEDAIVQTDPAPPSTAAPDPTLARSLRGDLDTIVLKALKKDPAERYATVNNFGDDVHRFLDGRPVLARPDSRAYRFRKFIARNRIASAATAATVTAIVAGTAVSLWQAHEAGVQRNAAIQEKLRADTEAAAARRETRIARANAQLTDYLTADLAGRRSTTELEEQLERAVAVVRSQYRDDPVLRLNLLVGLAGRFRQLGNFERHRALAAELEATAPAAGDTDTLAQVRCWRARDLSQAGNARAAQELIAGVLQDLRSRNPVPTGILASCLADASAISRLGGNSRAAIAAIEEVRRLEEGEGIVQTDTHSDTLFVLARAYAQAGRYREAAETGARSVQIREAIGREDTPGMINMRAFQASVLREGGQPDRALRELEALLRGHASRGGAPESIAPVLYETALTLLRLGRAPDALPLLARAAASGRERGDSTMIRAASIARTLALTDARRWAAARAMLKESEALYVRQRATRQYTARLVLFAGAHLALATGDAGSAAGALDEARQVLDRLQSAEDPAWRVLDHYTARLALLQGRYADARQSADAALRLSRSQSIDPHASLFIGEDLILHAQARQGLGDAALAAEDAGQGIAHLEAVGATTHPWLPLARAIIERAPRR